MMTSAGFTFTDDPVGAGTIIINTCAFIEPAVEESIDAILDHRAENTDACIVVAGCLPMRYESDLEESLPEANLFLTPDRIEDLPNLLRVAFGTTAKDRLPELMGQPPGKGQEVPLRILTTQGYAYLKIAEGCSRKCRYCTIPSIRGPLRSIDPKELEQEANFLAAQGVRELVLVAQDLTAYGLEKAEKHALVKLLARLERVEGIRWIRLMYLYPDAIPRDLPKVIRDSPKILPYLDIPFQHVSDSVLKAMGRPWKGDRIRRLVDGLRENLPRLTLRTTVMVGFPGEGDAEFKELSDFVETSRIDHVGVFTYSPEENTRAFRLGDPIPEEVKETRANQIRSIHARHMRRRNRRRIGTVEQCLVESVSRESDLLLQGRLWDQAPEIDGALYITAGQAVAGEIHQARITGTHQSDLFGEIVQD